MYYVYLLKSLSDNTLYIGCTNDLKKRFEEHNKNMSGYTKKHSPWKIVYFEGYCSREDAFNREKSLKRNAQGLRRLKDRLNNSLQA